MEYKPVNIQDELRKEIFSDPESLAIYEATKIQIDLAMSLKKARVKEKMTQQQVARKCGTQKENISRIESIEHGLKHFPSLLTISKYAAAIGYEIKINLIPIPKTLINKSRRRRARK